MAGMLSYVALGLLVFVGLVLFYGIIAIHDIPYEISKSRNHPHQDAIHVAGWVSLFTLHVLWPFLWIWATLYRPERGWGFQEVKQQQATDESRISALQEKLDDQAERLTLLEQAVAEKSLQNGEGSL
ncbi:GTPase [Alcanivorax sp. HI0083]|jgi:hypothetical protein|uniref:DUF3302 domain-containing protein n=2 Tax=Alcanivorax TaxID=59753 RepID=UPI0007B9722E|nr:GTPase [Alcanivorax sp. HI0044]KZY38020.1 GTPase [Alcanivorax sp. HI0044]KZZ27451.1 GTPase [Alcanivorax sp. HI0083]